MHVCFYIQDPFTVFIHKQLNFGFNLFKPDFIYTYVIIVLDSAKTEMMSFNKLMTFWSKVDGDVVQLESHTIVYCETNKIAKVVEIYDHPHTKILPWVHRPFQKKIKNVVKIKFLL